MAASDRQTRSSPRLAMVASDRQTRSSPRLAMVASDRQPDPASEPRWSPVSSGRDQALSLAWRALNRRERTEAELLRALAAKGVEPAVAEDVVAELRESGYVDDASYARRFAADRRHLDDWGAERIERRLRAL